MMGNAMSVFLMFGIVLTLVGTVGTGFVVYQRRLQWQEICRLADNKTVENRNRPTKPAPAGFFSYNDRVS